MKKNQIKELVAKSKEELVKTAIDLKIEIGKIRIQQNSGKMRNVSLLREKRKDLSRILTMVRLKELA